MTETMTRHVQSAFSCIVLKPFLDARTEMGFPFIGPFSTRKSCFAFDDRCSGSGKGNAGVITQVDHAVLGAFAA